HGVTSSGKTEIYIKCIERVLAQKKKVLYLLPEISLTTQLTPRIQNYFGDQVCVYHSKCKQN
ncbi:DEAD/DEAH box helicase family protein, partial [Ornithobacterium rhinotracheale]